VSEMFVMYLFSTPSVVNPVLDFVNFLRSTHIRACACVHTYYAHTCRCKYVCMCIRYCVFCILLTCIKMLYPNI